MLTALTAFDQHPQLLLLDLVRNYGNNGLEKVKIETDEDKVAIQQSSRSSLNLRCLLMSAWHTAAAPAIDVRRLQRKVSGYPRY